MAARDIILKGAMAAADLLNSTGGRQKYAARGRVDVFDLPASLEPQNGGIPLVFQHLDGLLGAFLPRPTAGVLVTTQRSLSVQRFTAAHEIGHAVMGHEPSLDDDGILRRPMPRVATNAADRQEGEANAFASALLLPQWLLSTHASRHGWTPARLREGEATYQLGLRVGLSYHATCMALLHYKRLDMADYRRLVDVPPKDYKRLLLSDVPPPANWFGDVWHLTTQDGDALVEGGVGDHLVIDLVENAAAGYLWDVEPLWKLGLVELDDRRFRLDPQGAVGGPVLRRVTARCDGEVRGVADLAERRPWESNAVNQRLRLELNLIGAVRAGEWSTIRHHHAAPQYPTTVAA